MKKKNKVPKKKELVIRRGKRAQIGDGCRHSNWERRIIGISQNMDNIIRKLYNKLYCAFQSYSRFNAQ